MFKQTSERFDPIYELRAILGKEEWPIWCGHPAPRPDIALPLNYDEKSPDSCAETPDLVVSYLFDEILFHGDNRDPSGLKV